MDQRGVEEIGLRAGEFMVEKISFIVTFQHR